MKTTKDRKKPRNVYRAYNDCCTMAREWHFLYSIKTNNALLDPATNQTRSRPNGSNLLERDQKGYMDCVQEETLAYRTLDIRSTGQLSDSAWTEICEGSTTMAGAGIDHRIST